MPHFQPGERLILQIQNLPLIPSDDCIRLMKMNIFFWTAHAVQCPTANKAVVVDASSSKDQNSKKKLCVERL